MYLLYNPNGYSYQYVSKSIISCLYGSEIISCIRNMFKELHENHTITFFASKLYWFLWLQDNCCTFLLPTQIVELDLATVVPCCSGPKRPHDKVAVTEMKKDFNQCLTNKVGFKVCNIIHCIAFVIRKCLIICVIQGVPKKRVTVLEAAHSHVLNDTLVNRS